jgi:hypothetical protein
VGKPLVASAAAAAAGTRKGDAAEKKVRTEKKSLEGMIKNFRDKFGNGRWKAKEMEQLEHAKLVLGDPGLVWEDVRADGTSDGAWGEL